MDEWTKTKCFTLWILKTTVSIPPISNKHNSIDSLFKHPWLLISYLFHRKKIKSKLLDMMTLKMLQKQVSDFQVLHTVSFLTGPFTSPGAPTTSHLPPSLCAYCVPCPYGPSPLYLLNSTHSSEFYINVASFIKSFCPESPGQPSK